MKHKRINKKIKQNIKRESIKEEFFDAFFFYTTREGVVACDRKSRLTAGRDHGGMVCENRFVTLCGKQSVPAEEQTVFGEETGLFGDW